MNARTWFMAGMAVASLAVAENIKVLQYNIHGGKDAKNVLNLKQTLATLKTIDADIGGLNEVDEYCGRSQFSDITGMIRKDLKQSALFAQAIPLPNGAGKAAGSYGLAVMSKRQLRVVEQFTLPVGSSEGRTAIIVRTLERHPIYFVSTHLPWQEGAWWDTMLINCLKKIESRLKEGHYYPAILTGDLNRRPDNAVIDYLRKNWTVCNDVNPQNTWPADKPEMQIDYIAFQPKTAFKVIGCQTVEDTKTSDHRPLTAELQRNIK